MRWVYSAGMVAMQPLLVRRLLRRARSEPLYGEAIGERFGRYGEAEPAGAGPLVWVHAVSLGETRAAAILVAALRAQLPGMRLLLTHGTATGRAEGQRLLRTGDRQCWLPWDTPQATRRFLAHFRPSLGILMETEVWPNLLAACAVEGVPLALANARMSEKSLRQSQRLAWLARPAYRNLRAVWAQTEDDAARLLSLGAAVQGVFGNLKFDATPDAAQLAQGRAWRERLGRAVVLLASAREGEEDALLVQLRALGEQAHAVQWLIVPRHPQRFDEVAALIASHGFAVQRRSGWRDGPLTGDGYPQPTIWLGDSLGEMALYYAMADAALLGGSFAPLGGQNLIEAAACGCPVLMGPHTFNFAEAATLAVQAGAARRCLDLSQAVQQSLGLVADAQALATMRQATWLFCASHRGAAARTAAAVADLLAQ
jgi:3-deoxy-D-manno-octulosonic-acid transferase